MQFRSSTFNLKKHMIIWKDNPKERETESQRHSWRFCQISGTRATMDGKQAKKTRYQLPGRRNRIAAEKEMVWATWRPCRDPQSDTSNFTHERNKTIQINTRQKHRGSTYHFHLPCAPNWPKLYDKMEMFKRNQNVAVDEAWLEERLALPCERTKCHGYPSRTGSNTSAQVVKATVRSFAFSAELDEPRSQAQYWTHKARLLPGRLSGNVGTSPFWMYSCVSTRHKKLG